MRLGDEKGMIGARFAHCTFFGLSLAERPIQIAEIDLMVGAVVATGRVNVVMCIRPSPVPELYPAAQNSPPDANVSRLTGHV